jgi:energy-coupling factor transporter ATP-binding protein EcfA2
LADKLVAEGRDVYFACGTLREKFIEVNGKRRSRCAENIHEVKSLFLDLDVGEGKGYPSQKEAIAHLVSFIKDVGMPKPLVVSSGYGVHVYWPFTQAIAGEKWRVLAAHFKALTQAYGLHADPARTADVASILRLPGTYNYKNPADPREVKVLGSKPIQPTPPKTIGQIIVTASKNFNAKPAPIRQPAAQYDTGLGSFEVAQEPADFKDIAKRCQAIRTAVKDQANTSEPMWFAVLQVVRHCHNADQLSRVVSHKHPTYTPEATAAKMQQLEEKNVGPTLCDTFDSKCPGACNGCEHRGKIKTPLVLGRSLKEATDRPAMVIDHGNGEQTVVELPKPPYPYQRTTSGAIAIKMKDEAGNELEPEVIYDYDIYPIRRMYDEVERCEIFTFRSWLPQDGWREYQVPAFLIYDERKLMELLAREGVYPDMAQKSRLVGYMLGYIQTLQRQQPADQIYSQFGWRRSDMEVVIGNKCFSKNGIKQIKVNAQFEKMAVEKFESKGTLEAWKRVVNVYNHEGAEDFAFALMMGFGQLLFKFTGYEGALFNLYGDPGAGKSTVLKLIHSIYGVPTEKSLLHQDTTNAKLAVIGCYNNLPITYDEITNIEPQELSDLAYAISNGRGKEALRQDRTLRTNNATWQTTMFTTSNSELVPMISALKGKASGETYRIMERSIRATKKFTLTEARQLFEPLQENYGLAGAVLAEWLVNHLDEAKAMMADAYREISERVNAESPERFWLAMCAQAIVGARLGKRLGLHEYDDEKIIQHAVRIIQESRGVVIRDTKTPTDIVVEFMNTHVSSTLATETFSNSGVVNTVIKPTRAVVIRRDITAGRAYIDKIAFRNWAIEKGHSVSQIVGYMEASGIIVDNQAYRSLGYGTEFDAGRSQCFVLDTHHQALSGTPAKPKPVVSNQPAQPTGTI